MVGAQYPVMFTNSCIIIAPDSLSVNNVILAAYSTQMTFESKLKQATYVDGLVGH
jgi:hypothetical protein